MDISAITSIPVTPSLAVSSTRPVSFLFFTPATADVTSIETVDISGLGRLLSAISIFENTATDRADFSTVLAGAQFLVDAFNDFLQSDSLQSPLGGSLGNLFVQMLEAQTAGASESGESVLTSLSRIGINFLPSDSLSGSGSIAIDLETIQAAFNTDPSGTIGVLTQAGRAIGRAASEFTNLFVRTAGLAQSPQGLLDADLFGGALAVPGSAAAVAAAVLADTATDAVAAATAAAVLPAEAATPPTAASVLEELAAAAQLATEASVAARATIGEAGTIVPSAIPAAASAGTAPAQAAAAALPAAATVIPATVTPPVAATEAGTVTATATAAGEPVAAPPAEELAAATTLPLPVGPAESGPAPVVTAPAAAPAAATRTAAATATAATTVRAPAAFAAEEPLAALPSGQAATVVLQPTAAPAVTAAAVPPLPSPDLTVDASNPAVAAAIAAYHVVDGIFDSSKPGSETTKATFPGYSEIRPVVPVRPGRLDLHA